ncbi:hypothetical protein [Streptomyces sp. NBC_00356]|uniref:hypothetical protein n=1 Tax=Streptomyces sp. NBC_00356 TaxID=2975724 RepID=UPI002E26F87D
MNALPEPRPTVEAGQPGDDLLDATVAAAVEHSIDQARKHGTTPQVVIGTTPPVPQPDSRIVPTWATGIAVASLGVGAGATGLGCAVWLAMKGLSMVSVPSLERFAWIIIAPFAGAAMLATAIGVAITRARNAEPREVHNHNNGPVYQDNSETTIRNKWWGRSSTNKEKK